MPFITHDPVDRRSAARLWSVFQFTIFCRMVLHRWNPTSFAALLAVKVLPLGDQSHTKGSWVPGERVRQQHMYRVYLQTAGANLLPVSARALAMCISLQICLCGFLFHQGFWGAIRSAINGSHKSKEPPALAERCLLAISWITSAISKY